VTRVLRIRGGLLLALSTRDFRLLWTGQLLSGLGSWMLLIAAPYKVFELTRSPAATGFAFAAGSATAVAFGPVAGVAVDRWDRRRTMMAVSLGQGGCILPVALVHQSGQVGIVYLALLAESALGQFYGPAEQALVPGIVGRAEELTSANALMSVGGAVTRLAGAPLGGIVFGTMGLPMAVAIDAGTYAATAGCLLLLRWRPVPRRASARRLRGAAAGFGEGLRHVSASRPLRRLLVAAAMFWAGNGAFTALLVPYIHLRLHGTAADVGFLWAATGAGFLIGAPLGRALHHRLGLRPLTATSLLITAAAYAIWFSIGDLGPVLLLAGLTGMSAMVFLITRLTCLQQCSPDPVAGRTYSIFFAVEAAAGLAGTATGGVLEMFGGFTAATAAAAVAIACSALTSALPATAARSETSPSPRPPGDRARRRPGRRLRTTASRSARPQAPRQRTPAATAASPNTASRAARSQPAARPEDGCVRQRDETGHVPKAVSREQRPATDFAAGGAASIESR
jgi:MFS family permease